jgi:hypothetical protein
MAGQYSTRKKAQEKHAMIKTKDQLKNLFANGSMPNGNSFANLIDSMALESDYACLNTKMTQGQAATNALIGQQVAGLEGLIEKKVAGLDARIGQDEAALDGTIGQLAALTTWVEQGLVENQAVLGDSFNFTQWVGAGGRFGLFDSSTDADMPSAATMALPVVAADGQWHTVVAEMSACVGFEVVASVVGVGKAQAITHALVLGTAYGGGPGSIRQTRAYGGLGFWRRISFRWQQQQLQVKTHSKYEPLNNSIPSIQYHITRIW